MNNNFTAFKNSKAVDYLTWLFICLPPVIYFLTVSKYAVNLPYYDDYNALMQFLNDYTTSGLTRKFALLLSQHNDHRILSTRLLDLLYYTICGNINFRNLIFIGNTQLIIILAISISFIRKMMPDYWRVPAFIISLFIFDMNNWNNADWAMASLQNYGVVTLFFISVYFYSLDGKKIYLVLGALFQVLCTFSSGNGIVGAVCLVLYTIISRDRVKMIVSVATFLCFSLFFFFNYKMSSPSYGAHSFIISLLQLTSGHFYIGIHNYNAYILEATSVLYFIGLALLTPIGKRLRIEKRHAPFVAILLFILGTMAAICRHREIYSTVVPSRYLIYSNYILGILFVFFLLKYRQYRYSRIAIPVFVVLMLVCFERNYRMGNGQLMMWRYLVINGITDPTGTDPEYIEHANSEACSLGIYCIAPEKARIK